jgi:hypothetical protein
VNNGSLKWSRKPSVPSASISIRGYANKAAVQLDPKIVRGLFSVAHPTIIRPLIITLSFAVAIIVPL